MVLNPPLPVHTTDRIRNARTGRNEVWGARGPGYRFVRTGEPGTPWYAEDTELLLIRPFESLIAARTAATNGLREQMIGEARRAGRITGNLISHHAAAMFRCACGGLLVDLGHGTGTASLHHVDGCTECTEAWSPGEDDPRRAERATAACCPPCRNQTAHVLCGDPRPVTCWRCDVGYVPLRSGECACGGEDCCGGCCEPDEPAYGPDDYVYDDEAHWLR